MSETAAEGAQPVPAEIRDNLVEPFIAATRAALGEMAGADVVIGAVSQGRGQQSLCGISVMMRITSATEGIAVRNSNAWTAPNPPLSPCTQGARGRGEGDSQGAQLQDFARLDDPPHPGPLPPSTGGEGTTHETCGLETALVLSFPEPTAAALARRILADVEKEPDEQLIQDCVGEIGNVVAGQAKALLAGTPYAFTFSLPKVVVGDKDFPLAAGLKCLLVAFHSDQGEFTLRLFLNS